jgi:hypothetical protein
MDSTWKFDQPPNCGVITTKQIAAGKGPVLHVTHDLDDHGWQFLGGEDAGTEDAAIVGLSCIVDMYPEVVALAEMPPGWHAWRRSPADAWIVEINSRTNDDPEAG